MTQEVKCGCCECAQGNDGILLKTSKLYILLKMFEKL